MPEPPTLALYILNFAAEATPDLPRLVAWTRVADEVGIDRVIVSEHVALGERLDEYGHAELGGRRGRHAADRS